MKPTVTFEWSESITQINENEWNEHLGEKEFLHKTAFLSVVEQSKINNTKMFYFRAFLDGKLISTAVVAVFEMNLDLFITQEKLVNFIKKIFPNIFKVKLLFCGTPISAGQTNFWINPSQSIFLEDCLNEISRKMREISKKENIKFSAFKEFDQQTTTQINDILEKQNFVRCWSLPTVDLRITGTCEEYWQTLSSNKRRQINISLKKIGFNFDDLALETEKIIQINKENKHIKFTLTDLQTSKSTIFHQKYMQVMDRAKIKFETLNAAFFETFFDKINAAKLLNLEVNGEIISSFLIMEQTQMLTFLFVSKQNHKDNYDSYFNLLTMLVKYAHKTNKKLLQLGQTTYYTKMRMGGQPKDLFLFFKGNNKFLNFFIKKFNNLLFPKYVL